MREQVTSQAPTLAVGYRLVLPARQDGDPPRLSPKRRSGRDVAWYLLAPFEYPDDIRLRDGCWYRIVWVDAQGRRIRLQPGEPVPALYFFLGPAQARSQRPSDSSAALPPPSAGECAPAEHGPSEVATPVTQQAAPSLLVPSAPPNANAVPTPALPASNDFDAESFAEAFARARALDKKRAAQPLEWDAQLGPGASLAIVLPPPPTTAPPERWTQLLASFPPLTPQECLLQPDFLLHPELIVQIRYEERLAVAKASGQPRPREPVTMIDPEARQYLHAMFGAPELRPYFWSRCQAIFEYVQQHGVDVLAHLPIPIPQLPPTEQRWIETAVTNPAKRAYIHYVCARQDALLSEQDIPVEPNVALSSKERNQIRKIMQDVRAVMLFKQRVPNPAP